MVLLKFTFDGFISLKLFNKEIKLFPFPCKYTRLYSKRFKGLTQEEIKYILEFQFKYKVGYKLNLDDPKTFNEKIQWMKIYDNDPLKTQLSDKYLVREWVKEKIGEKYLIPLYGVWNSFDEINFNLLPEQFVLKSNHGCSFNYIDKEKRKLNLKEIKKN